MAISQRRRILVWGRTAPELSSTYYETVCTGGVFEDGTPVRIYPIPYRYLDEADRFKKYQWITANLTKNPTDSRPESYRIDCDSIEVGEFIPPDDMEWYGRREIIFQKHAWQFDSMDVLLETQQTTKLSLALVKPIEILSVKLHKRDDEERRSWEEKRADLRRKLNADRAQLRLFEECMPEEMKGLDFLETRISVKWKCASGKTHSMQMMDWETAELQRKVGDEKALDRVRSILNLDEYSIRFYLGNFLQYQTKFAIVGLWYPKRKSLLF